MNVFNSSVRFRPVRIGWCLHQDDWVAYRETLGLNFILAGGQFNPLIPIDDENYAQALIRAFRVDILLSISEDAKIRAFIEKFPHLKPPSLNPRFWDSFQSGKIPHFVDISHSIKKHFGQLDKNSPDYQFLCYDWQPDDPLANVFLATYGKLPPPSPKEIDYAALLGKGVSANSQTLTLQDAFPIIMRDPSTFVPRCFCRLGVKQHYRHSNHWECNGFYVGHADDFQDMVNFWNLQATDLSLVFYDPTHADRLQKRRQDWLSFFPPLGKETVPKIPPLALWGRTLDILNEPIKWATPTRLCKIDITSWNGSNIKVPYMYFTEHHVMGIQSASPFGKQTFSIQSPAHPFDDDVFLQSQQMVIAIQPQIAYSSDHASTLQLPFVPELNDYYDRAIHAGVGLACTRVEPDGVGFIKNIHYHDLSIHPVNIADLISQLFALSDVKATLSDAGLTTQRLIHQMGGLQQCRLFKIPGVRKLIRQLAPTKAFSWKTAVDYIRGEDQQTKKCSFDNYSHVYLNGKKLTPDAVMETFLERKLFSAGLQLSCPNCPFDFWASNNLPSPQTCEYCQHTFNILPYLKDHGIWHFRPSGLFATGGDPKKGGDQKGAIPTILTLQQLEHALEWGKMPYCASINFRRTGVKKFACESDFVVVLPEPNAEGKIEIVLAECKAEGGEITAEDVEKLSFLADALPKEQFRIYILFSKLTRFSPEELDRIALINTNNIRAIIFSTPDLETLRPYETLLQKNKSMRFAGKLKDMAEITHSLILSDRQWGYPEQKEKDNALTLPPLLPQSQLGATTS